MKSSGAIYLTKYNKLSGKGWEREYVSALCLTFFFTLFNLTNGSVCACTCMCMSDAAGGNAKLAIVSMSAWQLTLTRTVNDFLPK